MYRESFSFLVIRYYINVTHTSEGKNKIFFIFTLKVINLNSYKMYLKNVPSLVLLYSVR